MTITITMRGIAKAAIIVGGAVLAVRGFKKRKAEQKKLREARNVAEQEFDKNHPDLVQKLATNNEYLTAEERAEVRDILKEYRKYSNESKNLKQWNDRFARYKRIVSEFEDAKDANAFKSVLYYWRDELARKRSLEAQERMFEHERSLARDKQWSDYCNSEKISDAIKGRDTNLIVDLAGILL